MAFTQVDQSLTSVRAAKDLIERLRHVILEQELTESEHLDYHLEGLGKALTQLTAAKVLNGHLN